MTEHVFGRHSAEKELHLPGERHRGWSVWRLVLLLVLVPGKALADIWLSAATLELSGERTRVVIESRDEVHFKLLILRYPERLVLELEGVALDPELAALTKLIAADHPYLKPLQIRLSPSGAKAVQLEFGLKADAEPSIRALQPAAGRGYRLVLDIAPTADAARSTATARVPQRPTAAAPTPAPAGPPAPVAPVAPSPPQTALATPMPTVLPVTSPPPLPRNDDLDLVLLELRLDGHVLAEAMTTYQANRETFLPLGELARLLTLAIRTQPGQGMAEGFVLSEARRFSLNVALARVALAEQTQGFDPALVRLRSDDIYVASSLLSRWLPLDFEVNLSNLTLQVQPRERLPLQARLERERLGARAGSRTTGYEDPGYPRQPMPYRLLGVPFIDQTLGIDMRSGQGSRQTNSQYTAYLTGDLLGMESALFINRTQQEPSSDVRFTLARHDPDAGLLGPLRARSVMFGSGVQMPSVANIIHSRPADNGYGVMLSNRTMTQPTSFDRHTLRGDLPPGWDVELYFNEVLIGFQSSSANGRYSFDDQPLTYGPNEFRLVFHGPLGQQRVERQSFLLEQSSTQPGEFYYQLSQHRDGAGLSRSVAQFEWGLNKHLTGTGGFVRAPTSPGIPTNLDPSTGNSNGADSQLYTQLGLRAFWRSFIFSSDLVRSPNGGALNESGLKTRVGNIALSYSRTQLHNFESELYASSANPLVSHDQLRLDGAIPAGWLPRLPWTLALRREQFESGPTRQGLTGRVAAYVRRTSVSNQLSWQSWGGNTSASGVLQLSRRVGDIGLNGQLGYRLKPQAALETIVLTGDKRLDEAYRLSLGLTRSLGTKETQLAVGINKSLGNYGFRLSTSFSSLGGVAVGLQLFMAMGWEPRERQWRFDALPKADSGAASVRVFLDDNANGTMDFGEEPIENVAMNVNGSRALVRTNAAGIAWLDRLPTRQHVDIAVDTQTLEDPYWAPQRKGLRLVPRPGHVAQVDFPVIWTSEIDGTVYLVEETARRGIGDVVIELLDLDRRQVSTTKSSSDGYYIVPAVAQGRYRLRVAPEQLKQFDLRDPGERDITILPNGEFISGEDFILSMGQRGPVSAPDKSAAPGDLGGHR